MALKAISRLSSLEFRMGWGSRADFPAPNRRSKQCWLAFFRGLSSLAEAPALLELLSDEWCKQDQGYRKQLQSCEHTSSWRLPTTSPLLQFSHQRHTSGKVPKHRPLRHNVKRKGNASCKIIHYNTYGKIPTEHNWNSYRSMQCTKTGTTWNTL